MSGIFLHVYAVCRADDPFSAEDGEHVKIQDPGYRNPGLLL